MSEQDPYTRIPAILQDIVSPLLSPPERDCLLYLVRRTWGVSDTGAAPKARDTIPLEQFEKGTSSGNRLLDLGTQLARNTIRKALEDLEGKELVEIRYSCLHCFWEQAKGQPEPDPESPKKKSCPRCKASLTRAWALADLTPRKVAKLLNEKDKFGRTYYWDKEERRFHFEEKDNEKAKKTEADILAEIERLRSVVWYPELVDKLIKLAASGDRKVTLSRQLNNFWKPVWELQEAYPETRVVKHSLEQTIRSRIPAQRKNYRWYKYMQTCAENYELHPSSTSEKDIEADMRALLRKAAELNGSGKKEEARALLSDILSQTNDLAQLFDGDRNKCENSLREAFKQGTSDFVGIAPNPYGLDFYPEWSWS